MNVMSSLLSNLLSGQTELSKNAAAELIKSNSSQLLATLLKSGLDLPSAKTLIEHFATSLFASSSSPESLRGRELLTDLIRHFASLPERQSPADIQSFKKKLDTLFKQILHTLTAKPTPSPAAAPLHTYTQNQLMRHTELNASLVGTLHDTDESIEQKERREQQMFGLAEDKSSGKKRDSNRQRGKRGENIMEFIQILLAIKHALRQLLKGFQDFQKNRTKEEVLRLVPDIHERIRYIKERIDECDAVLKQLY